MSRRDDERQLKQYLVQLEDGTILDEWEDYQSILKVLIRFALRVDDDHKTSEMARALSQGGGGHGFR